jgi:DNA-directed RNA polymerase subunit RPC12/RpoP
MPSAIELDQRIAQIQQEFSAVLGQAVAASEAIVAATQSDFTELERLWRPVDAERDKAQAGMTRSWNACSRAINREHESDEARDYQMNKCDFASLEIEIAYQGALREVRARAAQAMLNFALHSDARSRACTACAQPITSILIDRAQNIQCPACGAPQLVEPGMAFRVFASVGALFVGHYDGMHSWADMERYEMRIQKFRKTKDVPMQLLHDYHNAALNYWTVVFNSEAQLVPAMAGHAPGKIEAYMKPVRKLLRSHWQWREMEEGQPSV